LKAADAGSEGVKAAVVVAAAKGGDAPSEMDLLETGLQDDVVLNVDMNVHASYVVFNLAQLCCAGNVKADCLVDFHFSTVYCTTHNQSTLHKSLSELIGQSAQNS
jgi:hypothetical protein